MNTSGSILLQTEKILGHLRNLSQIAKAYEMLLNRPSDMSGIIILQQWTVIERGAIVFKCKHSNANKYVGNIPVFLSYVSGIS